MAKKRHTLLRTLLLAPILVSATITAPPASSAHCLSASTVLNSVQSCHLISLLEISTTLPPKSKTILIDPSQSEPPPFFPWSYKPYCHKSPTLHLCVYTNTSFASGRGISIFTTPEIAETFSQLPIFQDPSSILSSPSINRPESSLPGSIQAIPSKGLGVLASRPIKRGERITAHTPLLLVYREEELSTAQRETYLRRAVEQLPPKSRDRYFEMATIYGLRGIETQDRLKANIFGVEVGGLEHLAIWPEAARVNHDCGPNSQYRIDPTSLVHWIHAARDIKKGEEITITYTNPFYPSAQRRASLNAAFGFNCQCQRCQYSADTDHVIMNINKLQEILSDWSTPIPPPAGSGVATVADADRLIGLYKEEGLDGFLDVPYGHAALMYSAAGDAQGVVRYASLAREAVGLKEGIGKGDWNFWRRVEEDPEDHWSWGRRRAD